MPINSFMAYIIRCNTLFDITQTGVISRRNTNNSDPNWVLSRNQQCNFDTIVQAISLRSQPENITTPVKNLLSLTSKHNFGSSFNSKEKINYWSFVFEISHATVFDDGVNELGLLYTDCDKIPMIKCGTECKELYNFLDTDINNRNIYFEVIDHV